MASTQFKSKTVIPGSPEAAQLGKYGNVPVSLFTGTPKITIPIYEIKGSNISLPISLSYDASGFNPQKQATWVGLNWSLNAGGVITRSVMGFPDRLGNYFGNTNILTIPSSTGDPFGYYDFLEEMNKGNNETQPDVYYYNFGSYSGKFVVKPDYTVVKRDRNDLKFVSFDPINTNNGLATIIDGSGNKYYFTYIESSTTLLDDRDPVVLAQNLTYDYPSAWYLSSIESADGKETILISYNTNVQTQTQFSNYLSNQSKSYEWNFGTTNTGAGNLITSTAPIVTIHNKRTISQIVLTNSSGLVARVEFKSSANTLGDNTVRQDVDNVLMPGERRLDSILVYNSDGVKIKKALLNYEYFGAIQNPEIPEKKRLKLHSIQEVPVDGSTASMPAHIFEYNNEVDPMPSTNTSGIDHWGYYNEAEGNTSLIPNLLIDGVNRGGDANREPSLNGSVSFLVKKIFYPSGGFTEFEYELHQGRAGMFLGAPLLQVGGVRIRRIKDYAFLNKVATIKNYSYLDQTGATTGIVCSQPEYVSTSTYRSYCGACTVNFYVPEQRKEFMNISANSIHGLGTIQGSHIGYQVVTEFMTDENNIPLGKTVYKYAIGTPENGISTDVSWSLGQDDYPNGDLLEQEVYDKEDKLLKDEVSVYYYKTTGNFLSGLKLITSGDQSNKQRLIKYDADDRAVVDIKYIWGIQFTRCPGAIQNTAYPDPICDIQKVAEKVYKTKYSLNISYSINETERQKIQTIVKQFDQLSNSYISFTQKVNYSNPDHIYPTKIEENTKENEWLITEKKYAADYSIPTGGSVVLDNASLGINNLLLKNIRGAEVESIQYRQNLDGSNKRVINGSITEYDITKPFPTKLYRLEIAQPLSIFSLSTINTQGQFSMNSNYEQAGYFIYDNVDNTLIQQSKVKDMPKSYIWDYGNSLPVAEVSNATSNSDILLSSFAYSSFETGSSGNWTISKLPHQQTRIQSGITGSYSFKLLSGVTITKTNLPENRKYILSYWSKNGVANVSVTRTSNFGQDVVVQGDTRLGWTFYEHRLAAGMTAVSITGNEITIDELRLHPSDALMTTITYTPLIGITSQCSSNNAIAYFYYDGYNRLINVADQDGNLIKNYKYNYGLGTALSPSVSSLFYNEAASGNFTRQCTNGGEPNVVVYQVPYGRYVSSESQTAANAKATAEIQSNGQAYANQLGECRFYNSLQTSTPVARNNCIESGYGPPDPGMVFSAFEPARAFYSLLSIADANSLALQSAESKKQAYVNSLSPTVSCSCVGVGKKYIGSSCVIGDKIYTGIKQQIGNFWYCQFYYSYLGVIDYSMPGLEPTTANSTCPQN